MSTITLTFTDCEDGTVNIKGDFNPPLHMASDTTPAQDVVVQALKAVTTDADVLSADIKNQELEE